MEKFGVGPDRVIDVQALAGDFGRQRAGRAGDRDQDGGAAHRRVRRPRHPAGAGRRDQAAEAARGAASGMPTGSGSRGTLVTLRRDVPLEEPLDALEVRDPDPDDAPALAGRDGVPRPRRAGWRRSSGWRRRRSSRWPRRSRGRPPPSPASRCRWRRSTRRSTCSSATRTRSPPSPRASPSGGAVAIEVATGAADEMRAPLVGLGLAIGPGEAAYLPIAHVQGQGGLFDEPVEGQVPLEAALAILEPLLEDAAVLKIGQNVKAGVKLFARHGIRLAPIEDTMLLSYALHAGLHGHGIDYLAEAYLGHVPIQLKIADRRRAGARGPSRSSRPRRRGAMPPSRRRSSGGCGEALRPRLPFARVTRVYETMERPLVPVLGEMERAGIRVDRAGAVAALGRLRPAHGGARGGDLPPRRPAVQPRQPEAARRGALRPDGPRRRPQGQDRRLHHRRGRARGAGGPGPRPAGADARLAAPLQAEVDLHRHAAGRDQPRDGPGAYLLPDRRRRHRPAGLDRAEPAEHPRPHRGGPPHPRGLRGGAGKRAPEPRLFPDRAPHPRACRQDRRAEARPSTTASTSTR